MGGTVTVDTLDTGGEAVFAQALRSGTIDGEKVGALARVVMDSNAFEALAVIWLLYHDAESWVRSELTTIRDHFLAQFG